MYSFSNELVSKIKANKMSKNDKNALTSTAFCDILTYILKYANWRRVCC